MGPFRVNKKSNDIHFELGLLEDYNLHPMVYISFVRKFKPLVSTDKSSPPDPILYKVYGKIKVEDIV